jgi:phage shock protein A
MWADVGRNEVKQVSDDLFKQHKKYLMRYIHAKRSIDQLEERLFEMDKRIEAVRAKHEVITRIQSDERESLNDRINQRLTHARYIRTEISTAIDELENPDQANILEQRFADGLTLEAIAKNSAFSLQWVEELYRRGVRSIKIPPIHV